MTAILSYALTSVADVKESLGIASSNTASDNLITRKINEATVAIENYCGRRFASTTYTNETYSATNIDAIMLKNRPVTALTSLDIRDSGLNYDTWETIDTHLYFCDAGSQEANAGVIKLMFNARGRWARYRVTYTAGYTTIPSDLAEACATIAAYYVNNADGNANLKKKQEGSRLIEYYEGIKGFNDLIKQLGVDQVLDSYANMPVMTDR